jgi:hypothetical protein
MSGIDRALAYLKCLIQFNTFRFLYLHCGLFNHYSIVLDEDLMY